MTSWSPGIYPHASRCVDTPRAACDFCAMPIRASSSTRESAIRRVLVGILVANLVVVLVKFGVGIHARSLAVFGDAIQATIDVGNNVFSLLVMGVRSEEHTSELQS